MASPSTLPTSIYTKGLPLLTSPTLNPHATVGKWLLSTSSLVFAMVHIGGVTRLTKSGLSMTNWQILGSRPPLTHDEWLTEFDRYKTFPEWEQRQSMTLDEFKYIYYWEWGHRMMGRFVGVVFGGGWVYFTWIHLPSSTTLVTAPTTSLPTMSSIQLPKNLTSAIPPGYQSRLALLFAMGGTQGLVGWWMVKSGLGDDRRGDRNEIRVSPYRLATHLGMAVATYSVLLWTGLGVLSHPVDSYVASASASAKASSTTATTTVASTEKVGLSMLQQYTKNLTPAALQHAQRTRIGVVSTVGLTGLTILSGAFVAGNDAGNAYNTYPLMNGQLIPWEEMIDPTKVPQWRNLFETTATVQWNHRLLGTCTALSALGVAGYGLFTKQGVVGSRSITPQVQRGLMALGTAATAQMSLGIATLLNYVPITLAASHQLGSLVVLTCGIYTAHSLRYAGRRVVSKVVVETGAIQNLVAVRSAGGGGAMQKGAAVMSKVSSI
jgi:cytochrome c oxidase assembly protein subunit 15